MNVSILTNKHFVLALIVSPILAVIAWFAVDKVVAPEPFSAELGASYPLAAKSNCRYDSGKCALSNGDVKILLEKVLDSESGALKLKMHSNFDFKFARIELLDSQNLSLESLLVTNNGSGEEASVVVTSELSSVALLRFASDLNGSIYYAETTTEFLN